MDLHHSAQDVSRCGICEIPAPPLYCEICDINLCSACSGEHLLDESKEHKLVLFKKRGTYYKCKKHSSKICEMHCEQCDIPICTLCIASKEHQTHNVDDIMNSLVKRKTVLQKILQELEISIFPEYQEIASSISVQRADLNENTQKMTTAIDKHGENLHKEIDIFIQKLKSDLNEIDSQYLALLKKQECEIAHTISEITEDIAYLKKLLNSNDANLVCGYKSQNAEFRKLPPKLTVSLPRFTPQEINKKDLLQQVGSLSMFSVKMEVHGYTGDSHEALDRSLINVPRIITEITTNNDSTHCVSCLSDDRIFINGIQTDGNGILRLYSIQGEVVKSIQTKSGNRPFDIAVTRSGDLVYTDKKDRAVNVLKNTKTQTVKTLQGWIPCNVCSAYFGDLLVVMESDDDEKQIKVVRYSGSTETQCIQYGNDGQRLYLPGGSNKYISENRNLDICVADSGAKAVVVVNHVGKFRFIYTAPPSVTKEGSFYPIGITTDSQCRILTADFMNSRIHILDQDGHFLRYIDNCSLKLPYGLCMANGDNLFVVELMTNKVKKIQYCM